MDRHVVAMTPSQSDAASAAPARAHIVRGWDHGASAAVAAAAMPRSPCRRRADTARRPVLYVPGQCGAYWLKSSSSDDSLTDIIYGGGGEGRGEGGGGRVA
jgi:hypothetical protein